MVTSHIIRKQELRFSVVTAATGHTLHANETEEPVISLKKNCSSAIFVTFQRSYLVQLILGGHYASKL
jgi:20S proteasome alpha/beta subunit